MATCFGARRLICVGKRCLAKTKPIIGWTITFNAGWNRSVVSPFDLTMSHRELRQARVSLFKPAHDIEHLLDQLDGRVTYCPVEDCRKNCWGKMRVDNIV